MDQDLNRYVMWLQEHGVPFELGLPAAKLPDHDGDLISQDGSAYEHRDADAGIAADHATEMVATCLARPEVNAAGRDVWDIGCGTGVLMVAAAHAGAASVSGTDVDPRALELARDTLREAQVDGELFETSLMDAVPADRPADLLIANLPHKPCPSGYELPTSQRGGPDGSLPHTALAAAADHRLRPGGQVVFFLHSLPDPRLLQTYAEAFDLTLLAWKRRYLQPGEYAVLLPMFEERVRDGSSLILERDGRSFLIACTWLATKR